MKKYPSDNTKGPKIRKPERAPALLKVHKVKPKSVTK